MIVFEDAAYTAPDSGSPILHPVNLVIEEGHVAVVGANGSGKSTLARMVNGLIQPTSGSVTVNDLDTVRHGNKVRQQVGFLFTDPTASLIMPTAVEDVMLSLRRTVPDKNERMKMALAALEDIGLGERADVAVTTLSGGQRQLLALAGILAVTPSVIVADEPTTLLDLRWRAHIGGLLRSLPVQLIEVTHDLDAASRAERLIVVDDGHIAYDGDPREGVRAYRDMMYNRPVRVS